MALMNSNHPNCPIIGIILIRFVILSVAKDLYFLCIAEDGKINLKAKRSRLTKTLRLKSDSQKLAAA